MSSNRRVLCLCVSDQIESWCASFKKMAPDLDLRLWPEAPDAGRPFYVAAWNPPPGFFSGLPAPKAVFALGAGIDRLLKRDDLPVPEIPLIRLIDAGMAQQMVEYALAGVLRFQRNLDLYESQQAAGHWQPQPARSAADTRVTVLGLGRIGGVVATTLTALGYHVSGWSRQAAQLSGVDCRAGAEALEGLLGETDILVNILPSTPATRGLLNRSRLSCLPVGAGVINAGRGDQLDLGALFDLLDTGHLRGAVLDVFPEEPLRDDSSLWRHPKLLITPHVAANTLPEPSVRQVVENIRRLEAGEPVEGLVDRQLGY
ncbi:glyoxylate/hydroxypyruvate reductase A [Telmatospirillum sp.]|uniref:2-hydroxyacid dehydrogenase n=1 Tax=Telmatospirillum sp. TaxID=2079197 RepID=UPI00284E93AA|nr:glyoxylate/hydroxypyruvate reductase A [Telmatospirillum sp.]MDR3440159.1 glyoxylate/hydroxypyruvate reductase A [Telmatospirillum sp.]